MTDEEMRRCIGEWWWQSLGNRDLPAARARAARLRRAQKVEVLADPAVHDLARELGLGPARAEALIRVVQVLAELRGRGPRLARAAGAGDPPAVSRLRFERLIRSTEEELATAVRRVLPMVGRACDPGQLGRDVLIWDEATRIRWSFEYFGAPAPDPAAKEDTTEETGA
ncbi:type I-E CRISPR-associated protein Cse2/CasB [Marinibacterium profundimaris]|uniref:CRISPR-associated protein Cse2 n=1 Tax=Marinibacterium profundimaris TaxID=1679460 RepID=A0A225NBR7_9RHOB|nr:type I-E CRISPR-associated protein Cse2/CasB [Marinibacterium profundimaris]OWU68331.1 hypothetical protein ATO3_24415 [Marinibacterium profundimaris]